MLLADCQESKPDWLVLLFKNLEEVNRLDLAKDPEAQFMPLGCGARDD
jgi:hypothetical protein